ncbi:MAG TPA: DEAD/DEAH box helicase [Nannocystaceae bacterium]|nr:DEAD/DEAH box helicase [Nannocystaceae bacterium]
MTFDQLGLDALILRAVKEAGYREPTPIQQQAIGPVLAGRDIVGCAQTGTGKTAAFALPILQRVDARAGDDPVLRALVLTPTRELAAQIGESFATYGKHLDLWHTVIFGGVGEGPQLKEINNGIDILVATPGRLLDLHGRGKIDLRKIEIFVLDEADRMLDQGFMPDVRRVIAALPPKRQNLLFSATMPPEIRALADAMLHEPVSVAVAPERGTTAENIEQRLYFVEKPDKPKLLLELLRGEGVTRTLVFSRTKHGANRVAQTLERAGLRAAAIHGNKSQNARTRALDAFKKGELRVLVATDLAARGIDIDAVSHVINFDLPNVPETYVHRIGRTARAGASGIAMSMCDLEEREYLVDIERLIGRHIERVDHAFASRGAPPPTDLAAHGRATPRPAGGAPSGRRRGGRRGGGGGHARPGHGSGRPASAGRRR